MNSSARIQVKEFHVNSPRQDPRGLFLLAHGAKKGMATPFMETMAKGLVESGVRVVRFHFPFMEESIKKGIKIPADGGKVMRKCFSDLIIHAIEKEGVPASQIIIGGKSTGGRIASMIADRHKVAGLICYGYPFHPPKLPTTMRIRPLKKINTPTLICQGERDPNGRRNEIMHLGLPESVEIKWISNGDNSFRPGRYSPRSLEENMQEAIDASNAFISRVLSVPAG